MSNIEELQARVVSAEARLALIGEEHQRYSDRLVSLMSAAEAQISEQSAEAAIRQAALDALHYENEQLRTMLHSLLLAVEAGKGENLDATMHDMEAKFSALLAIRAGDAAQSVPDADAAASNDDVAEGAIDAAADDDDDDDDVEIDTTDASAGDGEDALAAPLSEELDATGDDEAAAALKVAAAAADDDDDDVGIDATDIGAGDGADALAAPLTEGLDASGDDDTAAAPEVAAAATDDDDDDVGIDATDIGAGDAEDALAAPLTDGLDASGDDDAAAAPEVAAVAPDDDDDDVEIDATDISAGDAEDALAAPLTDGLDASGDDETVAAPEMAESAAVAPADDEADLDDIPVPLSDGDDEIGFEEEIPIAEANDPLRAEAPNEAVDDAPQAEPVDVETVAPATAAPDGQAEADEVPGDAAPAAEDGDNAADALLAMHAEEDPEAADLGFADAPPTAEDASPMKQILHGVRQQLADSDRSTAVG